MILVAGGAGYIGSHMVHRLLELKKSVIVIDNLYSGHRAVIPKGIEFIKGDIGDDVLVRQILKTHKIESVVHFAAHLEVEESTRNPEKYYKNNFDKSRIFIKACAENGVKNFIFSSTCAVYGAPEKMPVREETPTLPINPYGKSKLMVEWFLHDYEKSCHTSFRSLSLRYFNVAGAKVGGGIGQATPRATQLVKVACEVIEGKRAVLKVFGTDYETPDGTCVRDYIHVDDLVEAHVLGLDFLSRERKSMALNCGYGHGFSVKEVVEAIKKVSGVDFPVEYVERRPGDAPAIYADPARVKSYLGWEPRYDNLEFICETSLQWERELGRRSDEFQGNLL